MLQERTAYGIHIVTRRIYTSDQRCRLFRGGKLLPGGDPEGPQRHHRTDHRGHGHQRAGGSVSINAALAGSNDIAISNVVGSNIFNGLVVVGICAFLHSFMPHGEILKRDMPLNILVTVVLCLMFFDGSLSRIEGAVLLLGMIVYLGFMIYSARKNREEGEPGKILSLPRSLLYIAGGLAAVIFGGDLVVDKACIIATNLVSVRISSD